MVYHQLVQKNAAKSRVLNLSSIVLDSEQKLIDLIINDKKEWGLDENEAIKLKKFDLGFMTSKEKCQPNIHKT